MALFLRLFLLLLLLLLLVSPPENMIYKGLDEDESAFLQFVVDRQIEQEDEVVKNEIQEVSAYRVSQHVHT